MEELPHNSDEVPVSFVRVLIETGEEQGFDLQDCLDQVAVERSFLDKKSNHITYQQQQELVQAIVQRVDVAGFGLLVGQKISILDWGILGYAFISSPNMHKAFDAFSTYQRLNGPMLNVYCMKQERQGVLSAIGVKPR